MAESLRPVPVSFLRGYASLPEAKPRNLKVVSDGEASLTAMCCGKAARENSHFNSMFRLLTRRNLYQGLHLQRNDSAGKGIRLPLGPFARRSGALRLCL